MLFRSVYSRGKVRGTHTDVLNSLFNLIPAPDLTILLDVNPALALSRKNEITYWEAGKDIYPNLSITESFLLFQGKTRKILKQSIKKNSKNYICISSNDQDSPYQTFLKIIKELKNNERKP